MRNLVAGSLFLLALLVAAPAARATEPSVGRGAADPTHYYQWLWLAPPAPAAVRACVAELERLGRQHPDVLRVQAFAGGTSITLQPLAQGHRHEDFTFAVREAYPTTAVTVAEPEAPVIDAAMLILRDHFPAAQLAIAASPPGLDLGEGRQIYQRATGRQPAASPGFVSVERLLALAGGGGRAATRGLGSSRTLVAIAVLVVLGFALTGRGARGYGSYYLFWLVAPTVIGFASAHPWLLAIVPVGLVARRWLPDPLLWLRRAGRVSSLRARLHANPDDAIAQRQLAMVYLELRRPGAAAPLAERALAREPESAELHHLHGLALLGQRRWDEAVDAFVAVLQRDARFRYGEPYLRLSDGLARLGRWKDAAEALEFFLAINGSSVEGWAKLAAARRHLEPGGREASATTRREARQVFGQLPGFQRRQQLFWYLRTFV